MDYRKSHIGKSYDYHNLFVNDRRTKMIWNIEQVIIPKIIRKYFSLPIDSHLDFACGTGRILNMISYYSKKSTGIDISESMTKVASKNMKNNNINIKLVDITKNDIFKKTKFNLITAFRFFPHAEKILRDEVMTKLFDHMNENSLLIFNNHANLKSFRNKIVKVITMGRRGNWGYSLEEMHDLINKHDLEIIDYVGIGLVPVFPKCPNFICDILTIIEVFFTKFNFFRKNCENIIFICKKTPLND